MKADIESPDPPEHLASPTLDRLLAEAAMSNQSALNDPLVANNVRPLQPFFGTLLAELDRNNPDSEYVRFPGLLGEQLDLFTFALQQRLVGSHYTIRRAGASAASYHGGWQRILESYDFIARSVLQSAGVEWRGFVVIGFSPEYHRFYGGVINLPREAIHPRHAWGMLHELGHEWGAARDITRNRAIVSAMRQLGRKDLDHFVWEVASEAFAWYYGFGEANWQLCDRLTWDYLSRFSGTFRHPEVYLARWLVADSVRRQIARERLPEYDELGEQAIRMTEKMPTRELPPHAVKAAASLAWDLRGIAPAIAAALTEDRNGPVPCMPAKKLLSFHTEPPRRQNDAIFFLDIWYEALATESLQTKEEAANGTSE